MDNDLFAYVNNSNQSKARPQKKQSKSGAANYKTCRNSAKRKNTHMTESDTVGTVQLAETSPKKATNLSEHLASKSQTVFKPASSRSEISLVPFNNTLSNQKHKGRYKRSANCLVFSKSEIKQTDSKQQANSSVSASAYRPGILYSDVLFGAAGSNFVTPQLYLNSSANGSQKKPKNCSFNFKSKNDEERSARSELECENLFPTLEKDKIKKTNVANSKFVNSSRTKIETNEKSDVDIISNFIGLSLAENNVSNYNYFQEYFQYFYGKMAADDVPSTTHNFLFSSITNIPKWNFWNVEKDHSNAFPKFLRQFDDENYLKAEKLALA